MENIFFLVLVAVVGLLRVVFQAVEKKRNAEAQRRNAAPSSAAPIRPNGGTEEERVRKFFDALGVPPTAVAPPPKARREITPKAPAPRRKILPVDPFPVPRSSAPIPPFVAPPEMKEVAPSPPELTPPRPVAAPVYAKRAPATFAVVDLFEGSGARIDPTGGRWAARLATHEGLRDAIVLREIFGPPRSLQTVDGHSLG